MIGMRKFQEIKYRLLLVVLIILLVVYPFFDETHLGGTMLDLFISFLIVFVVYESSKRKHSFPSIGYGDIIPVSRPAQMLSVFEAFIGQLYLAVIVARFVPLYISHQAKTGKMVE